MPSKVFLFGGGGAERLNYLANILQNCNAPDSLQYEQPSA